MVFDFLKKKKERDLPKTPFPGSDKSPYSEDPLSSDPFGKSTMPSPFEAPKQDPSDLSLGPAPATPAPSAGNRDMEMINLKLDAIKNVLENISLRIARLEEAAGIKR